MDDFRDLLLALNKFDVHYVIIGGYAVGVHYDPRTTKDLNVFVETSEENSRRIFAALKELVRRLAEWTRHSSQFSVKSGTRWVVHRSA